MSQNQTELASKPAGAVVAGPAEGVSLSQFQEYLPFPYQLLDAQGILQQVNAAWLSLLDRVAEDVVGRPFEDFVAPESREPARLVLARLKAGGSVQNVELILAGRLNARVLVVLAGSTGRDAEGRPVAGCVLQDITGQRRLEGERTMLNRQIDAFHRISAAMQTGVNSTDTFNAIAREVSEVSGFPITTIELCDFERSAMMIHGTHGMDMEGLPMPFEVPMDVAMSTGVARTGDAMIETQDFARHESSAPFFQRLGLKAYLSVPIRNQGRVLGALSLAHRQPTTLEPQVYAQVESLANYLGTLFGQIKTREAFRRSQSELAAVYDRAPSVMCLFDEWLELLRVNRAAMDFVQCGDEEQARAKIAQLLQCRFSPAGGSRCPGANRCGGCELRNALTETLRDGKAWLRVRLSRPMPHGDDLEERVMLVSTERVQVESMTRVLLLLEDVTERERADEQIRSQAALLDISRDAILVRDFSDQILYWSAGAERMYGWEAGEVVGKTTNSVLLGWDTSSTVEEALRAVRDREQWSGEMKHQNRKGDEITVQSRWTLVRDRNKEPKAILIVSTDITENKRLELQLLRAQRLQSIGTLASGLAHDLNNVLAPIMMAVQFLKEEATDEATRTWAQTLETCSQRGADIVRQVLMFARGVEGSRSVLNPKHLVSEMQRIARETFPRAIEIQTLICKQPWLIEGDVTQMQQVLMNLCVNARDAMANAGGTLTIQIENKELDASAGLVHPKAQPGMYVVLTVIDTGCGIPPEILDKIFDPFFTTKPLGQGTGLGLPTVMGIVENHGGFVLVESQPGKGSAFHAYIPAAKSKVEVSSEGSASANVPKGNNEMVLIVDDEPAIRKITHVLLTRNGYRTLVATQGQEALDLFNKHPDEIKLVVTDLMMPQMDGPATIRAIRAIRPGVKTITVTGLGEEGRRAEARAAGTDAFLNKPFTAEQLLVQVNKLLK